MTRDPYLDVVDATTADLAFLLENLGQDGQVDGSVRSLAAVEAVLASAHAGRIDAEAWPELVDTLAQLVARYAAVVLRQATSCGWSSVSRTGEPFLEVVPGEGWNRFLPLQWQRVLRTAGPPTRLTDEVGRLISERKNYDALVAAMDKALAASAGLSEAALVQQLSTTECAPDGRFFAAAARRFPKRVASVLRRSRRFRYDPSADRWVLEA